MGAPIPRKEIANHLSILSQETPPCFSKKDWRTWLDEQEENYKHLSRIPDPRISICEACEFGYQFEMIMRGDCLPLDPDKTPIGRRLLGIEEE